MIDFTAMDFGKSFDQILRAAKEELTQWGEQRRPIHLYGLGFYKLPLYDDRARDGCAFHLWMKGLPSTPYHHTHIFDLDSLVLMGGIENRNWTLLPSLNGAYEKRMFVGASDVRPTGEFFNVETNLKQLVTAGESYSVDRGDFHTSHIVTFPTLTLVRRRNVVSDDTIMDLAPRNVPRRTYAVPTQTYENMWGNVKSALALL